MPSDVAPSIALLALATISESPTNPRKTFDQGALDELTESVREKGILQPVLVRPSPAGAGYELVFGHRRARAARAAGLSHVPAMVAALDDRQVLEAQVVENQQRTDVHPLEEADGYLRLHELYAESVKEIAAKVGKSESYIYGRMKLGALCESGREAFAAGELDVSRALLIARIPDPELQGIAVMRLTAGRHVDAAPLSYRASAEIVEREFMLRLVDATFPTKACTKCPKRTGAQPELFADVASPDLCTDPPCYRRKTNEAWEKRRAAAEKSGQKVLTEEQTKAAFPYGDRLGYHTGYVDLETYCRLDPEQRTWGELVGKLRAYRDGERTILARTEGGSVHEIVVEEDAVEALFEAGVLQRPEETATAKEAQEQQNRWEAKRQEDVLFAEAGALAIGECVARAEAGLGESIWGALVLAMLGPEGESGGEEAVERRGLPKDQPAAEVLAGLVETSSPAMARGLVVELAINDAMVRVWQRDERRAALTRISGLFGVDLGRLERELREMKEKAEKKKSRAKGKAAVEFCILEMGEVPKHCGDCAQTHCGGRRAKKAKAGKAVRDAS